jgi:hypothetical protein
MGAADEFAAIIACYSEIMGKRSQDKSEKHQDMSTNQRSAIPSLRICTPLP